MDFGQTSNGSNSGGLFELHMQSVLLSVCAFFARAFAHLKSTCPVCLLCLLSDLDGALVLCLSCVLLSVCVLCKSLWPLDKYMSCLFAASAF